MKIVITGGLQSGKSSFVKFLDEKAMNIEAQGQDKKFYTVGMDLATLQLGAFDVFVFGTPGLVRFKIMRDVIVSGVDGIVFLFDVANTESDKEAITILGEIQKLIKHDTPIAYCGNKQDLKSVNEKEIKKRFNLKDDAKIFLTSATTGKNVKECLKYIVNEIFNKHKGTLEIMRDYETDIKGLSIKLKKNKEEMRDLLNGFEVKRFIEIDRPNKSYKVRKGLKNI